MFPLTDFSLKELRILDRLIVDRMNGMDEFTRILDEAMWEKGEAYNDLLRRHTADLPELREMHVRVLTSIAMKKESETVNQN